MARRSTSNRQFPGSAQFVVDNYDVRAAFSKGGWQFMNDNFSKADPFLAGEQWVLGDVGGPSLDRSKVAADLKARYYGDFIKEWTNYVKTARVVGYTSLRDAAQKLKARRLPCWEFSSWHRGTHRSRTRRSRGPSSRHNG